MNINQDNINIFFNKYINFVDELSKDFNYDNNIKHLLYIIVPAFIYKYGIKNETYILNCFKSVKIYIKNSNNKYVTASFNRSLIKDNNGFNTNKYIQVNEFKDSNLSNILDNFIHEFNHAVNSLNNEINETEKYIEVRSGVSVTIYDKNNFKLIETSNALSLEEILNTSQTEEIINIIKSFENYKIDNQELSNLIYSISKEINNNYVSNAYYYQKTICKSLINNKTFAPTINNLRLTGFIYDIPELFDNVIGEKNSYKKLCNMLTKIHELIIKYSNAKIFKERYLNKIRSLTKEVDKLINEYEEKCIFK